MKEGFIDTNFSHPYPLNCLALKQQFILKLVKPHLFSFFLRVFYRHFQYFLNWPVFKFWTYRHDLFSHRRRKYRGQRKLLCSVRLPDDMTRTRGTSLCSERSPPAESRLPLDSDWHSCYAVRQESSVVMELSALSLCSVGRHFIAEMVIFLLKHCWLFVWMFKKLCYCLQILYLLTAVCCFLRTDSSSYAERYKQNKVFSLTADYKRCQVWNSFLCILLIFLLLTLCGGLRHCTTSRKAALSIPDGVTGILHRHYPSGRTRTLGPTQPLAEMSTWNIS